MADALGSTYATGVVPIVGMTDDQSRALITNLIFGSMWMGAMGWEIFMTLPFDWRLAKETSWRSFPSALHSAAYYTSRYSTMVFLVVYVATNATAAPIMDMNQCQRRINSDAAMFVVSEMSVLLVFMLRTIAIWNLNKRVVTGLTLGWLVTLGLAITIPAKGRGIILKGFCTWDINGAWVGVSMTLYAVMSFVCLVLTVVKLNRQGWRGLLHSLAPPSSRSIDSADVSRLLIQRTTLFFFIVLICIIAADVVYFTAPFALWELFAVPAYLAISSGLAGRIFRRSWKLTHSAEYNRPPSYFPGVWRNEESDGSVSGPSGNGSSRNGLAPIVGPTADALALHHHTSMDFSPSFVEGEFRGAAARSVKSLSLPSREEKQELRTGADIYSDEALSRRRASEPAKAFRNRANASYDNIIIPLSGGGVDMNEISPPHNAGVFGISEAPAFLPRAYHEPSTRIRTTSRRHSAYSAHSPPPFGYAGGLLLKGKTASVSYPEDEQQRPTTAPNQRRRRQTDGHVDVDGVASVQWLSAGVSELPRPATMSSATPTRAQEWSTSSTAMGNVRDDLIPTPSRSRLWLDSSAERARMEAAAGASTTCLSDGTSITSRHTQSSSGHSNRSQHRPSTVTSRRSTANKRLILESASEAGENLQVRSTVRGRGRSDSASNATVTALDSAVVRQVRPQSSRSSFLASSPAIVSNTPSTADLRADRNNYDFDAIRRTLTLAEQDWKTAGPSHVRSAGANTSVFSQEMIIAEEASERSESTVSGGGGGHHRHGQRLRPVTAPEAVERMTATSNADPLDAFRQAVEEDVERTAQRAAEVEERPRTSRGGGGGGRMSTFGGGGGASSSLRDVSPKSGAFV